MKIFLPLIAAMLCLSVSTVNAQINVTFSTSATSATAGSVLNVAEGGTGSLFVYVENNEASGNAVDGLNLNVTGSGASVLTATAFDIQNPNGRWAGTNEGALGSSPSLVFDSNAFFLLGFESGTGIANGTGPVLYAELQFSAVGLGSNTLTLAEGPNLISAGGVQAMSNFGTATVNAVLLGDVDTDGDVDFFDIQPFIDVLLAPGGFQAEADCDENGVVNFFDIQPFIDILLAP